MTDRFATADLNDAHPEKVRRCSLPFIDFGGKNHFCGPIRTIVTMEDTKRAKALFQEPGNGQVIVVDGGGSLNTALLGDIQAAVLRDNGWAGIIIHGAIRDAAEMSGIDIGVKALGSCFIRPRQEGVGAVDVPVAFGHVLFETGQYVYCDPDGILVADAPLI
ncbi:ribonuclease E activity regulator RraA [Magnetospira sp. QH-2]|uniref:ribonuclease E activity regulator RraA n=1 Tax=Magnetospira sp. (strain QH-2) TaxID=1288970 RepID=UPI0003E81BA7|nr:ribonuclease E activity regulator RraA [Magnetospira sp. QH-2]CCQ72557.1 Regulator of ribonuclease activity A [Magnetospira sp. QH-2]